MQSYLPRTLSLAFALLTAPIHGQLSQSQVEDPLASQNGKHLLKRQTEQQATSGEILIPSLAGLSIAANAEDALSLQALSEPGISTRGVTATQVQQLEKSLQPWIGKPITLSTLDQIARSVERSISPMPDSLVTASFPPQEITSGHIAVMVGVPLLQNLAFAGNPMFGRDFLTSAVQSRPGAQASSEQIRKDLAFLNRNPFRKATALWSPAKADTPAANLIIHVKEQRPWNIYAGFDNNASDALGDERFYLGGKFGNVFDLDHRLGWILLTSADGDSLHAANLNYEIPLPHQHILQLSTGISESSTTTPSSLIDNNGQFMNFRAMLETPLPDWKNLRHSWKSGFSLRQNEYQQGTNQTDVTIFQVENLWDAQWHDSYGFTSLTAGVFWNPGEGFISSNNATYASLGADDADSLVATIKAERDIPWKKYGVLNLRAEAQWTNEKLLPSNQFAAAGAQRIRGYDEGSAFYDKAILVSAEWQFRRISLPHSMSLRPHLFFDNAWLADHDGESSYLSSIGAGLQWTCQSHYAARLEIAQPLRDHGNHGRDPELLFSLNTFW